MKTHSEIYIRFVTKTLSYKQKSEYMNENVRCFNKYVTKRMYILQQDYNLQDYPEDEHKHARKLKKHPIKSRSIKSEKFSFNDKPRRKLHIECYKYVTSTENSQFLLKHRAFSYLFTKR